MMSDSAFDAAPYMPGWSLPLARFRLLVAPAGIHRLAEQHGVGSGEIIGRYFFARDPIVDWAMTRDPTVSFYRFVPDMATNVNL
jgi:hypothetical protein